MDKKNKIIIGCLFGILLLMVVGYAAFSSLLNINGTSMISSNWEVKITNIVSKNVVGSASNASDPTYDDLSATFKTNLVSPGDSIEYDVTVSNSGNVNVKLDKITLTDSKNSAIKFSTSGLTEGDALNVGDSAVLTVKVEYDDSVTSQPSNLSSTLTVKLDYSQNTGNSEESDSDISVSINDEWTFDYMGGEQVFTVPTTGKYKFEVWGAQGGSKSNSNFVGGYGGYSTGIIELKKNMNLYINVGGQGICSSTYYRVDNVEKDTDYGVGGYNGGGDGHSYHAVCGCGGGGATHIATKSGILSLIENNVDSIIIVAGGGAGAYPCGAAYNNNYYVSPSGGGYNGGYNIYSTYNENEDFSKMPLYPTQTYGFAFGTSGYSGIDKSNIKVINFSGGGGGFYGGYSFWIEAPLSGGTGYIGNDDLSNKYMICYSNDYLSCNLSVNKETYTNNTQNHSLEATKDFSKEGNGYARIVLIEKN